MARFSLPCPVSISAPLSWKLLIAEMYSLLLETYIKDPAEKSRLFHAIDTIPAVTRKAEWAMKWIQRC